MQLTSPFTGIMSCNVFKGAISSKVEAKGHVFFFFLPLMCVSATYQVENKNNMNNGRAKRYKASYI